MYISDRNTRSLRKRPITQHDTSADGTVCVNGTETIQATGGKRLNKNKGVQERMKNKKVDKRKFVRYNEDELVRCSECHRVLAFRRNNTIYIRCKKCKHTIAAVKLN